MTLSGRLPGTLPGRFTGVLNTVSNVRLWLADNIPGDIPGSFNDYPAGPVLPVTGVGWEFAVRDNVNLGLLSLVPRYTSASFMPTLSDVGSGEIVIDLSDPIFSTTTAQGSSGSSLLAKDNVWEAYYNGSIVFQWLATTVDVKEVDASSEQQPVTISGPGGGQILEWAKVLGPGFPNVVYKLGALEDQFNTAALNTVLWNTTLAADITTGIVGTDGSGNAFIAPRALFSTGKAPYIGSEAYNASSSYVSAKILPLGQDAQPANLVTNGSFVLGVQGWDGGSSVLQNSGSLLSPWTVDSEDGDNASLRIVAHSGTASQGIQQTIANLQPAQSYQINAWVKIISGSPQITLAAKDLTNSVTAPSMTVSSAAQWTPISTTITTGSTANLSLLFSINSGSPGTNSTFLVDNVQCYAVDPNCYTQVALKQIASPATNYAIMQLSFGVAFFATVSNGGTPTTVLLGYYDPVAHAYWRIRESAGKFYFDASPDNTTWQQLASIPHTWSATNTEIDFLAWQDATDIEASSALISSLNGGSSLALQQTYVNVPNVGGVFLDLLTQAQLRGTITPIIPTFTAAADSAGLAWPDSVSMQIAPGGDLLSQLQASATAVAADWIVRPGFYLDVGLPGSIGTDLSAAIVFYESGQIVTNERLRIRDSISNYIVAGDGSGKLVLASDASSIATWNQREAYIETSAATTSSTLNQIANATLSEFKSELSQRTLTVPPNLPGLTPFVDFTVGDWIGVQNVDLQTIDSVRVIAIAISISNQDVVTVELTLETRIQLFVEQMNALIQKIAATVNSTSIPAPGAVSQNIVNNISRTSANSYSQTIGDGTSRVFTIPHTFNTKNLNVTVYRASDGIVLPVVLTPAADNQVSITYPSVSQVTITFWSSGTIPTPNQYVVVISA